MSGKVPKAGDEYERKTPHEHVLLRPGMYIGQVAPSASDAWVYDSKSNTMVKRNLNYSPALLKLFDEILVNAADNAQRESRMSKIDVNIVELENGGVELSVRNDGKVIPIVKHSKENIYVPELIFGHLLTGSNFDDTKDAYTGGRHGYGAKLANIFSHHFSIEMYDSAEKMLYKQQWHRNMFECSEPVVETVYEGGGGSYLEIKFKPDLEKLGLDEAGIAAWMREKQARLESGKERRGAIMPSTSPLEDTLAMMQKRVYDIAACVGSTEQPIEVKLNNSVVAVRSFSDYVSLFQRGAAAAGEGGDDSDVGANTMLPAYFATTANKQWDVAVMTSSSGSFENISFVNSVWTPRGGSHVGLVTMQLVNAIEEALGKRGQQATSPMIRNRLMVFVKAAVANPTFDSQAKDALTTSPTILHARGGTALPAAFLKRIVQESGIVEDILADLEARERSKLMRSTATKGMQKNLSIPKLEDAVLAGTKRAGECSLVLTEGDSAKALAVAGLEVVGRERYGVMPLRGKILNVRGVSASTLNRNTELMNLVRALGLEFGKKYTGKVGDINAVDESLDEDVAMGVHNQGLRYGKVLIMTDQDHDGAHIKGLLINFFQHFWPSLLEVEGFLQQFITPLVKVRKKRLHRDAGTEKKKKSDTAREGEVWSFFSVPEYEAWVQAQGSASSKYQIKYYKGLGTNTAAEGRAYFEELDKHRKIFWPGEADGDDERGSFRKDADTVDLAFSKIRAADRKDWLENRFDREAFVDPYKKHVSVSEFINTDLMQFSNADNVRSIPHVVDGLKPSQRKVLFGCLKRKFSPGEEMKVVQLAGYISEQTAYHHGEASLHATIVNMAQDYVGSNNVPLLTAGGQFGTRAQGGKDYASPRYIFTGLNPLTRLMFPEQDDPCLEYLVEDGQRVEPLHYVPVLPNLLINGSYGIGTGWSCYVPPHDPVDLAEHYMRRLRGEHAPAKALHPWVRGFHGNVYLSEDRRGTTYTTSGTVTRTSRTSIEISELPVGLWTDDYKEYLMGLYDTGVISRFNEHHTSDRVRFQLSGTKKQIDALAEPAVRNRGKSSISNASGKRKAKPSFTVEEIESTLRNKLRLEMPMSLRNMHAFDHEGKIVKYDNAEAVCDAHFGVRMDMYDKRRESLLRKYAADVAISTNKSRFVSDILNGDITLLRRQGNVSEEDLVEELSRKGYESREAIEGRSRSNTGGDGSLKDSPASKRSYAYLLDMPIQSLTEERVVSLKRSSDESMIRLKGMQSSTPTDLWMRDLETYATAATSYFEKGAGIGSRKGRRRT